MARVLITGCNRGIGLALLNSCLARDHHVYALCRDTSNLPQHDALTAFEDIDVTSLLDLQTVADEVGDAPPDMVFSNAGTLSRQMLSLIDEEAIMAIQRQFDVNAVSQIRLASAFAPIMKPGSKLGIVSSRMGSVEDNTSGGHYGYRMSKAAANIAGKSLSVDLKDQGIAVYLLHPGYVQTDMTKHQGELLPKQTATMMLDLVESFDMTQTGQFWHVKGEQLPW